MKDWKLYFEGRFLGLIGVLSQYSTPSLIRSNTGGGQCSSQCSGGYSKQDFWLRGNILDQSNIYIYIYVYSYTANPTRTVKHCIMSHANSSNDLTKFKLFSSEQFDTGKQNVVRSVGFESVL
jgi:hypothetical protein